MLQQHHGVHVSASTSRRQTEELGAAAQAVQNEQARTTGVQKHTQPKKEAVPKEAVKQVLSSDGSHISLRGQVWAEVKTVLVGEVQENTCPSKARPHHPHSAEGLTRKGIFSKVRKKQTGEENVREY